MRTAPPRSSASRRRTESGFTLLEILIGGALLAIALLGHTASIFTEQRLSTSERARSTAILCAEQFLERLRADDSWPTLYARLRTLQLYAEGGVVTEDLPSQAWTGHAVLRDGRKAFLPAAYDPAFVVPSGIQTLHVLVEVPMAPQAGDPLALPVLREDLPLAKFGLPSDLDGDGSIDDAARNDDYIALPITVTLRWTHSASGAQTDEMSVSSWLWGYR